MDMTSTSSDMILTTLASNPVYRALAAVFLTLAFASIFNSVLRLLKPRSETLKKVALIIRSWWVIVGFLAIGIVGRATGITAVFFIISLLALREFLAHFRPMATVPYLKYVAYVGLVIQYAFLFFQIERGFLVFVPLFSLLIMPLFILFNRRLAVTDIPYTIGGLQVGLAVTTFLLSHVPALVVFRSPSLDEATATAAAVFLLAITELNDVGQFIAGKLIGRRKIVPTISPNKTLGGFLGGTALTILLTVLLGPRLFGVSILASVAIGFCLAITGILGDLFFSAIKRSLGIKDFGTLLPGHGGVLDRVDSLIFTGPLFFYVLTLAFQ